MPGLEVALAPSLLPNADRVGRALTLIWPKEYKMSQDTTIEENYGRFETTIVPGT